MRNRLTRLLLCLLLLTGSTVARAQVLIANDDEFAVPYGEALLVEAFGVLDNDTLDDQNAGEDGVTAELVSDVSQGTLALASNGSFSYSPGAGFDGSDSFVYRAVFGAAQPEATVTLSACSGGPQIFTCWKEAAFAAKAAELGQPSFFEGFENDDPWGVARSPDTALSVSSRGFTWQANVIDATHFDPPPAPPPPPNHITTGSGPARSGSYGVFDLDHGYATGTPAQCDTTTPLAHCLFHDGFTIVREPGSKPLHGGGGYFTGISGARVAIILDGDIANPLGGGRIFVGGHQFFGVIDAGPTSLEEIQFRELDGKIGQVLSIFGDDFSVLAEPSPSVPALGWAGRVAAAALLTALAGWRRW